MTAELRCMAAVGTAFTGPMFCGSRATTADTNGRPVCGNHRQNQKFIPWKGDDADYPWGPGGLWRYARGKQR